jgi:hydroxymethylpyrimidine/phosphomethylpyrimidine kinase
MAYRASQRASCAGERRSRPVSDTVRAARLTTPGRVAGVSAPCSRACERALAHATAACSNAGMTVVALSIAGSDPSGGAGIQADLKTFHTHRVYGCAVVTLITAQNTLGVQAVSVLPGELLAQQLDVLFADFLPHALKTGALGSPEHVAVIAQRCQRHGLTLVVDPVMRSKTDAVLLEDAALTALRSQLLPVARLVTPNLDEASALLGRPVRSAAQIRDAARALVDMGAQAALVKGGHREGEPIDVLCVGGELHELHGARVATRHTHGLGCTLSAAITARLALGQDLLSACVGAKAWLGRALASAPGLGHGQGPVNHLEPL